MASANPYAAPRAALNDQAQGVPAGRPGWVWVITVFLAFGIVVGALGTIDALMGSPMGGPEASAVLQHLVPLDHVVALVNIAISTVALVQLFRLKRQALALFIAAFALGVLYFSFSMAARPSYRLVFDAASLWQMGLGWLINVAIIGYVKKLRDRGILR